ncbi:hypothetical protein DPEC_G00018880 [Dallia pectoralis]|uniref:Uncharacterized protein n=1 Tax=Dallia pectoralis TaxID=75939 RepID=A0ACC2HG55_DALPE|nr:hypothetical protein DPEC_G00018880 [Dallia pectoralis]
MTPVVTGPLHGHRGRPGVPSEGHRPGSIDTGTANRNADVLYRLPGEVRVTSVEVKVGGQGGSDQDSREPLRRDEPTLWAIRQEEDPEAGWRPRRNGRLHSRPWCRPMCLDVVPPQERQTLEGFVQAHNRTLMEAYAKVVVAQVQPGHPVYSIRPEGKNGPAIHRNNLRHCPSGVGTEQVELREECGLDEGRREVVKIGRKGGGKGEVGVGSDGESVRNPTSQVELWVSDRL